MGKLGICTISATIHRLNTLGLICYALGVNKTSSNTLFPKGNVRFRADVETQEHHLRLLSEETPLGPVLVVFDVTRNWCVSLADAVDLQDGKRKALEIAETVIKPHPLPDPVEWKKYPTSQAP